MTAFEEEIVKSCLTKEILGRCKRRTVFYCSYYNDYEFHPEDKRMVNFFLNYAFKEHVLNKNRGKGLDLIVLRKYSDKICREYLGLL